jgi:hypothetical protein
MWAKSNQISGFLIAAGGASAGEKTVTVPSLPDGSSPQLHGAYRHDLKNLVMVRTRSLLRAFPSSVSCRAKKTQFCRSIELRLRLN